MQGVPLPTKVQFLSMADCLIRRHPVSGNGRKQNADAGTSPPEYQKTPLPDLVVGCRNADAGGIGLDAVVLL